MRGAKPFGTVHVVTGAEAAYANFYGHFHRLTPDGEWGAAWPIIYETWPVRLQAIYAEVLTAANLPKHGVPVWLYACWRPTDALGLRGVVQGYRTKAEWHGDLPCDYGFGVMVNLGSVIAGDQITIGGSYEPIR